MANPYDVRCRYCGHPAGYHSSPVCGYNHGGGRQPCACEKWDGVSFSLEAARARIAEVERERDAYMQAVLDTIHSLAKSCPDPSRHELSDAGVAVVPDTSAGAR